jgi:serine/threonine protein kinase
MELCECGSFGGCLGRLPSGSLVDERDVWLLAAQVAAGLAHVHAYGILHLDIKPDNIFLDRHGTYKVRPSNPSLYSPLSNTVPLSQSYAGQSRTRVRDVVLSVVVVYVELCRLSTGT